MTPDWQQPILAGWAAELEEQTQRVATIVDGLSPDQLTQRPATKKWSIAHCLDHLAATEESYFPYLEKTIARGENSPPNEFPDYRPGRFARWIIRFAGPDGRPVPAPKVFRPAEEPSPGAPVRFSESQAKTLRLLERADGIDLNRWKLRSPATPLLRFRVGEALELIVRHNERHLGQLERAREALSSSGSKPVDNPSKIGGPSIEN